MPLELVDPIRKSLNKQLADIDAELEAMVQRTKLLKFNRNALSKALNYKGR